MSEFDSAYRRPVEEEYACRSSWEEDGQDTGGPEEEQRLGVCGAAEEGNDRCCESVVYVEW
jgi:hypothetical protein